MLQEIMDTMKMNLNWILQRAEEVPEKGKQFLWNKEMMKQVKMEIMFRQRKKLSIATYVRRHLLTTTTFGHIRSNAGLLARNISVPNVEKDLTQEV